ncbi:mitochondrial fission protein ELM1 [Bradyrhizobium sp. S3.3.6]
MSRRIDVGNQEQGNRNDQGQHESELAGGLHPVTEQHVAAQRNRRQ